MNPTQGGPTGQTTTQPSPMGDALSASLRDILAGMAMGNTPNESVAYGGRMLALNGRQREKTQLAQAQQNKTFQFFKSQGLDDNTASYLVSDPAAGRAFFAEKQKKGEVNWQKQDLSDGTSWMIDMNDPSRRNKLSDPKPPTPSFGDIGNDPATGQPRKGFIDPRNREVEPYTPPAADTGVPSVIPPAPSGVDPKVWREQQSKRVSEEALPASVDVTSGLRKEVQSLPSYKNITQAAPVYKSMLEAANRDTRAADVNMIYGLAKIMDPTSVVRESEMTVAQAIATMPQQLQAAVTSQIAGSGRLSPEVRAAIMQEAHGRMGAYQGMFDQDAQMYRGIAQRGRINEADVLPSFGPFDEYKAPPSTAVASSTSGPIRVRSPDEARRLPKGTKIILPDGSPGVVP